MISALRPERLFVVVPCRNCADYIGQCLDSLQAQTFSGWTALVADDASDDATGETVRPYLDDPRIVYRRGAERAWLMGNTLAALRSLDLRPSDVVAILDGDDSIRPACLERIWEAQQSGYDIAHTDEYIGGRLQSFGRALSPGLPVRRQLWGFSHLRSFKAYLFGLLDDATFRDRDGEYFRAAGDLSLYLPMAELAGPEKIRFIPERLYDYRVHESCNFKVMREEQLRNNWDIRNRPALEPQTAFFDFTEDADTLDKSRLLEIGLALRTKYPRPCTVRLRHHIDADEQDSWRAYHNLWIADGVFLEGAVRT